MIFWTIIKVALKSLAANKLRSVLAMLGIIIAVWSVISALALGAGAQTSVLNQISALGTNLLVITPGQVGTGGRFTGTSRNLSLADAQALLSVPEISHVAPVVRGSAQMKYLNRNTQATVLGTSPTYFVIRDFKIAAGRTLSDADIDGSARVAVIGPATAKNLFGEDFDWCLGESIAVKGVTFRIVGILQPKGDQGWFNPDNQIIVPYSTAMKRLLGVSHLHEIDVRAVEQDRLTTAQEKATSLLRRRHRIPEGANNDFNVHNQADLLNTVSTVTTVLSLLLGGIAGISLLVGGIGIMNIMLVTVAERTREIGIRKAIGAKDRDILRQFLIESMVMSGLGGAIGLGAGFATAQIVTAAQDNITLLVRPSSVVLALGFSIAVGIFFGYYPARRAAKLDPIEALRYE